MLRIDNNPNFIIKAVVNGALRAYGVEAHTPRLAKRHLIAVLRSRGVRGYIEVRSIVRRGNPRLLVKVANNAR